MRIGVLALVLCLFVSSAQADVLDGLRTKLRQLGGAGETSAVLDVSLYTQPGGTTIGGKLGARDGPTGFVLRYDRAGHDVALQEERREREDPNQVAPSEWVNEAHALRVSDLLNFAPALLALIERGSVLTASPEAIEMELEVKEAAHQRFVKESQLVLRIALDEDGIPKRVDARTKMKAGLLFLNVNNVENEAWKLLRMGDRLIATHYEHEIRVSGLGNSFLRRVVIDTSISIGR